jgi:bacillithiol biosynthesis deacetylase BshB1
MKLDLLAIGAHPDDVEMSVGGTLALAARRGQRVGILHLTRGEMGTRGTAQERRREAEEAAEILGASVLEILDCGDGTLRTGSAEEDLVIELVRRHRPDLVLMPPPRDRHPDHGRAHRLAQDACFFAGMIKRSPHLGSPHRPGVAFHYMQHDSFEPAFVVDVTAVWEQRQRALSAYRSQVFPGAAQAGGAGPTTKISSEDFWHSIEGRARHFGSLVGATFGEPFGSRLPLAVRDVLELLPGGIR